MGVSTKWAEVPGGFVDVWLHNSVEQWGPYALTTPSGPGWSWNNEEQGALEDCVHVEGISK